MIDGGHSVLDRGGFGGAVVFHTSLFPFHTIPTQLFGAGGLFVFNKVVRTLAQIRE